MTGTWDLLLLDMTLPIFDISENEDGFDTEPFAGEKILREMKRRQIVIPTIVVTQFETLGEANERLSLAELRDRLKRDYPGTYKGTIYYSPGESGWNTELAQLLKIYD
jgi:hypothetical protein